MKRTMRRIIKHMKPLKEEYLDWMKMNLIVQLEMMKKKKVQMMNRKNRNKYRYHKLRLKKILKEQMNKRKLISEGLSI